MNPDSGPIHRILLAGETILWLGQPAPATKRGWRIPGLPFGSAVGGTTYAVTNQRVLKVREGLWRRVESADLRFLVVLEMDETDRIVLEELRSNWPDSGRYKRLTFEHLPDAGQVFEIIERAQAEAQSGSEGL